MAGNRKDHNRTETKKHIRNCFLQIYAAKGIDGVTVNELCRNAGVVKSTFYTYFEDKYSVLDEIEAELLDNLMEVNSRLDNVEVTHVVKGNPLPEALKTVDFIIEHISEYRAIMGPKGDSSFEVRWRRNIAASFEERFIKEKGDTQSAGLACAIFASTLIGLYRYFLFEAPDMSKDDLIIILGNTFKYALMDFQASLK